MGLEGAPGATEGGALGAGDSNESLVVRSTPPRGERRSSSLVGDETEAEGTSDMVREGMAAVVRGSGRWVKVQKARIYRQFQKHILCNKIEYDPLHRAFQLVFSAEVS